MWARLHKNSPPGLYNTVYPKKKSEKEMTDLTAGEIYIFVLWFITVQFLKLVWTLYILFMIWLLIFYVNNFCIEINFV